MLAQRASALVICLLAATGCGDPAEGRWRTPSADPCGRVDGFVLEATDVEGSFAGDGTFYVCVPNEVVTKCPVHVEAKHPDKPAGNDYADYRKGLLDLAFTMAGGGECTWDGSSLATIGVRCTYVSDDDDLVCGYQPVNAGITPIGNPFSSFVRG